MKRFCALLFCAVAAFASTHIHSTLLLNDGVTPMTGSIQVIGPTGSTTTPSTTQKVTIGAAGVVDFYLVGCQACSYRATYSLTNASGVQTMTFAETWIVPDVVAVLTIPQLWGGSSAPYYLISQQQISGTGLAAGQVWQWNGTAWVAATPLTGIVPISNGGTGTGSTLSGIVRGSASAMTAAELSGDATTSGSNAVTVTKINGVSLAGLATGIVKNTTTTGAPSIAVAGDFPTLNQNTSGTAAGLSGTPALPNGTTATTQTPADGTTKVATDAYVDALGATKVPTSRQVNGHALSGDVTVTQTDVGLGNVNNTSDANKPVSTAQSAAISAAQAAAQAASLPLHGKADTAGAADTATSATTATTAANIAAGSAGQFPYQTSAGATAFRTPNVANGPVVLDANGNAVINTTLLPSSLPVSVLAYGAIGNGIADDAAAVQLAINATPSGGTLVFGPGKTYLFSTQTSQGGTPCSVYAPSSIHIDLQGSALQANSSLTTGALICLHQVGTFTYENRTQYSTSNITRGDTTITLSTPAQASNFASGDMIYIQGETSDLNDRGINKVMAANASTGVLTLAWPVGKSYTSSPVVSDVQAQTGFDYSIANGTIQPGAITAIIAQQIYRTRLENLNISSATATAEPMQLNYMTDLVYSRNTISSNNGALVEFGGRSCTDCRALNNTLTATPSATGGAPAVGFGGCGEGAERCAIIGNTMILPAVAASSLTGLDLSGSYDSVVAGNVIAMGPSTTSAAIVTNNGSAAAVSPEISSNIIHSSASYAIIAGASDVDTITGNTIVVSGSTAQGIHAMAAASITGGSITGMASGSKGIIVEGAAAMATKITGVYIAAASGSSAGNGIAIVDPGSQQAIDPIIVGNQVVNYTTPIAFASTAHSVNRVVLGNRGVANYLPNALAVSSLNPSGDLTLSPSGNVVLSADMFVNGGAIKKNSGGAMTIDQQANAGINILTNDTQRWSFSGGGLFAPTSTGSIQIPNCTILSLPSGPVRGQACYFTDALTTSDCTVGTGTAKSLCVYDGAAWAKP